MGISMRTACLAMDGELVVVTAEGGRWATVERLAGRAPRCLAADPLRPERLVCGTAGRGVWTSDDAGASWRPADAGMERGDVTAVAVSASERSGDRGIVYAGTEPSALFRSEDGGATWSAPIQVNPSVAGDTHHVLPSLAIDRDANDVHVTYYTQHGDGTVDLDMANSHDRGDSFPGDRAVRISGASAPLTPSNIRLTANTSTNYDRTIVSCYCLGEYQGVATANGTVHTVWGDTRNTVAEPVNPLNPLSGQTHAQTDVFFQKVKAQ